MNYNKNFLFGFWTIINVFRLITKEEICQNQCGKYVQAMGSSEGCFSNRQEVVSNGQWMGSETKSQAT